MQCYCEEHIRYFIWYFTAGICKGRNVLMLPSPPPSSPLLAWTAPLRDSILSLTSAPRSPARRPRFYFRTPTTPNGVHCFHPHFELNRPPLYLWTSSISCLCFLGAQMESPLSLNHRPKVEREKVLLPSAVLSLMLSFLVSLRIQTAKPPVQRISWLPQLRKTAVNNDQIESNSRIHEI